MTTTRPPAVREHWVLLAVSLFTIFVALLVQGYATHSIAGSSTTSEDRSPGVEALVDAGPLLDISGGQITSLHPPDRAIALTFDDGPDATWTPRILDVLERHDVPATFFTVGSHVVDHPDIARRMVAEGHELGNHTFTHADLAGRPAWSVRIELRLTQAAIASSTGRRTALLRPPYSSEPSAVRVDTLRAWRDAGAGYLFVLSDLDGKDWKRGATAADIAARITPAGDKGGVILLHDGGGNRQATVDALDQVIGDLQQRGYRFVTVSALADLPVGAANPDVPAITRLRTFALPLVVRLGGLLATTFTVLAALIAGLSVLRAVVLIGHARRHVNDHGDAVNPHTPDVTIIVPAYNEEAGIEPSVRSLAASRYRGRFDIVVVDDGSTDATAELVTRLATELPNVSLITRPNGGKAAALNTGLDAATGTVVVTVDGDTVFQPDTLGYLVQGFRDPGVGAVSGNTKVANRRGLLGRWQHLEYVMGFNLDRRMYDRLGCMPTVPGAIGAFSTDALRRIGGFSTDTLAEDTDVTMALHRAGWTVTYEGRAVAWTEAPGSLRDLWKQRYRWSYGTMQSVWKHRRAVTDTGPGRRLGRIGIPYLLVFQVLLATVAPVVDVFTVYGLLFLDRWEMAAYWVAFTVLQAAVAGYALRLDGEKLRGLWVLPLQQFVYRQLMYLVVVQSLVTAASGARTNWQKLHRAGIGAPPPG